MGNNQAIPYAQLYDEWNNVLNCDETFFPKNVEMVVVSLKKKKGFTPKDAKTELSKLKTRVFVIVYNRPDDMFHVATVLQRDYRIEYIDSMASDQSGRLFNIQRKLEMIFRDAVELFNEEYRASEKNKMIFYDSFSMYGLNIDGDYYFTREPPQNCEQQFLGCFDRYCTKDDASEDDREYCECDNKDIKKYYKSLREHEGGDCIFWSHYIARELIESPHMTSEEWSKKMHSFLTNGEENATLNQMGARAAKFITEKIFFDLVRCKKDSL